MEDGTLSTYDDDDGGGVLIPRPGWILKCRGHSTYFVCAISQPQTALWWIMHKFKELMDNLWPELYLVRFYGTNRKWLIMISSHWEPRAQEIRLLLEIRFLFKRILFSNPVSLPPYCYTTIMLLPLLSSSCECVLHLRGFYGHIIMFFLRKLGSYSFT